MKGFKYQITVNISLSKEKINGETEYSSAYFNSITKTVINLDFSLDKSFEEILCRIDNWIDEGSGWIISSINGEYVNISGYAPLLASSFIELPNELKNSREGLINIKSNDNKCFLWCHVRHINLINKNSEKINKKDKILANSLNCDNIEKQNNICINVFCYDNKINIQSTYLIKNLVIAWIYY